MNVSPGKMFRLAVLVLGVIVIDILVFSPGFIGVAFSSNALISALAAVILLLSGLVLLYGSYTILNKKVQLVPLNSLNTIDDYEMALKQFRGIKSLEAFIYAALHQIDRMKKKQETLVNVLNQRFEPGGLSFLRFSNTTKEVEKIFYLNIRSILNRLNVFDEAEFEAVTKQKKSATLSSKVLQEKTAVYQEYVSFVKSSLDTNEEILLKLDKLLIEISRLDSFEPGDIDKMSCMQEIDSLISQTKYYKQ